MNVKGSTGKREGGREGDRKELSEQEGEQLLLSHLLLLHLVNLGDEPRGVIVAQHASVGQDFERPGVAIVPLHVEIGRAHV